MAVEIAGTQGTVSEAQWAAMMSLAAQKYTRAAPVNAVLGASSITIPPYSTIGAGVWCRDTANTVVPFPTSPSSGRWYLLVLRRTWGLSPSAQHVWLLGGTGTGITATNPPRTPPAARQVQPGITDDEPVLWFYYHSTAGNRRIVDASNGPGATVQTAAGLWDPAEQCFTEARVLADPFGGGEQSNRFPGQYRAHAGSWWDAGLNFYNYDQMISGDNAPLSGPLSPNWNITRRTWERRGDHAFLALGFERSGGSYTPDTSGYITAAAQRSLMEPAPITREFFGPAFPVGLNSGWGSTRVADGVLDTAICDIRSTVPTAIANGRFVSLESGIYRCLIPRSELNLSNKTW